eukprot:g8915.t1
MLSNRLTSGQECERSKDNLKQLLRKLVTDACNNITRQKPVAWWLEELEKASRKISEEVFDDPHVKARDMVIEMPIKGHSAPAKLVASPLKSKVFKKLVLFDHASAAVSDCAVSLDRGLKNFNLLVDSIDDILERADGHLKNAAAGVQREASEEEEKELSHSAPGATQPASRLPKPQVRWRHLIDNHRTHFVPRLLVKHNEESPLSPKLLEAQAKVGIRPSTGSSAKPAEDELQSHLAAMGVGSRPQEQDYDPISDAVSDIHYK